MLMAGDNSKKALTGGPQTRDSGEGCPTTSASRIHAHPSGSRAVSLNSKISMKSYEMSNDESIRALGRYIWKGTYR